MIIKVLAGKYQVGSQRGLGALEDHPEAVEELNAIIEWDKCEWPLDMKGQTEEKIVPINSTYHDKVYEVLATEKAKGRDIAEVQAEIIPKLEEIWGKPITPTPDGWWETETTIYPPKTDYLGTPPSLKPGDIFEYNNQTIAVDKDIAGKNRLVLYNSQTGFKALDRIFKEHIHPEYVLSGGAPKAFEMNISIAEVIPMDQCMIVKPGDNGLQDYFDKQEEANEETNLLDMMWLTYKIEPAMWNAILRRVPEMKTELKDGILYIQCEPNFEQVELWIDLKGRMIYNLGDLDQEEFEFIFPSLLPDLYKYLKENYYKYKIKLEDEET